MTQYVVFVDEETSGPFTFAASAARGAPDALAARREQLQWITQAAIASQTRRYLGSVFGRQAAPRDVTGDDVKVLEGLGALIVDGDALDPQYFEEHAPVVIYEDRTLRLPELQQDATSSTEVRPWHRTKIGLDDVDATGDGVLIGIIDTGIDATHPEFRGKTIHFAEFDARGRLISKAPRDAGHHGTHVAAIAAGVDVGIAPRADVAMAAVLTGPRGTGQLVQVAAGLNWLVTTRFRPENTDGFAVGVDIINASLGSSGFNDYLQRAVRNAQRLGILTVAAAGNDGRLGHGNHGSPGNYPECVGVGATDRNDVVADFSDWGDAPPPDGPTYGVPSLSAPGVLIYSALPQGKYGALSGTSMATPIVAGVGALRLEANPNLRGKPQKLADSLKSKVAPLKRHQVGGNKGGVGRIKA